MIELIVVMALLSILFTGIIKVYDFYKSTKSMIEVKEALYDIEECLSYGKLYCNNENISGKIVMLKINNEYVVNFYSIDGKQITTKNVRGIKLYNTSYNSIINELKVNIGSNGVIESTTIRMKDEFNKKYEIAIAVGSNKITIRYI